MIGSKDRFRDAKFKLSVHLFRSLQEEKASLEEQVRLLEQSQGYLKNQLAKLVNDTEKREELADLSERLLATERRELDLKEKVHTLQMAEQELNLALQEQRKINEELKEDLKDQDEILLHNSQIKLENQKLLADLGRLRESESFLSGRVDELELEASNLKADLCLSDKKIWDRERKWVEKVDILQDQLAFSSEDSLSKHSLKIEVEGLKNQTADLKQNLEEKSIELEKCETAFRAEVNTAAGLTANSVLSPSKTVSEITCSTSVSSSKISGKMGLVRYRSLRDHNGRYYLVVKIH